MPPMRIAQQKRTRPHCLLAVMFCLLGAVLLFSSPLAAHAAPLSLQPHRTGDGPCTQLRHASLSIPVMQGVIGQFTLQNTCLSTVLGVILVQADISQCSYGPAGASDWKKFFYIIGPDVQQVFTFQVLASCIKCDCQFGDPSRSLGFDLDIAAYNAEDGQQLFEAVPFDLYVGPDPGGPFMVGTCGAGIEVARLNRVS